MREPKGEGKVVKITNTGTDPIDITETVEVTTTIAPGDSVVLNEASSKVKTGDLEIDLT